MKDIQPKEYWLAAIRPKYDEPPATCQHPGCSSVATLNRRDHAEYDESSYFCYAHAAMNGFSREKLRPLNGPRLALGEVHCLACHEKVTSDAEMAAHIQAHVDRERVDIPFIPNQRSPK